MNNILSLIFVFMLISSKGATINSCKGEEKLFIQWYPLVSGWYTRDRQTCNYVKNISDNDNRLHYEFYEENGFWKLVEWSNYEHKQKKTLKVIYKKLFSLVPKRFTNTGSLNPRFLRFPLTQPQNLEDLKPSGDQSSKSAKNSSSLQNETTSSGRDEIHMSNRYEETEAESYDGFDEPEMELKIFLDRRCSCRTVSINLWPYTRPIRFYKPEHYPELYHCPNLIFHLDSMSSKVMTMRNNTNDSWKNLDPGKDPGFRRWFPEFYVSHDCKIIFYNEEFDNWYADLGDFCSPHYGNLPIYWTETSAPCVENMPPPRLQSWMTFQSAVDVVDPLEFSEEFFYLCDSVYRLSKTNDLKIFCSDFE